MFSVDSFGAGSKVRSCPGRLACEPWAGCRADTKYLCRHTQYLINSLRMQPSVGFAFWATGLALSSAGHWRWLQLCFNVIAFQGSHPSWVRHIFYSQHMTLHLAVLKYVKISPLQQEIQVRHVTVSIMPLRFVSSADCYQQWRLYLRPSLIKILSTFAQEQIHVRLHKKHPHWRMNCQLQLLCVLSLNSFLLSLINST